MTWCTGCGSECRVIEVDFGIGCYEYWGAPGVDTDLRLVSNCCEHETTDIPPNLVEPNPDLIPENEVSRDDQP